MARTSEREPLSLGWFTGKRVTVMGLGLHGGGVGIATWLMRHGARVTVTDLRDARTLASSVAALERAYGTEARRRRAVTRFVFVLGRHRERDFTDADMVIRNPAVPDGNPYLLAAAAARTRIETDISLFFLLCPFPAIGITGTRGKSTTTMLVAEMCRRMDARTVLAGNIRISPMQALDRLLAGARRAGYHPPPIVMELSSWQVEGLAPHRIAPHVGVVTNIKEDHLNRYRGIEAYARAKEGIVRFQMQGDLAVLNRDDRRVRAMASRTAALTLWFSARPLPRGVDGAFLRGADLVLRDGGRETLIARRRSLHLPGDHNIPNILAAALVAYAVGVPLADIRAVATSFAGLAGRNEVVAVKRGVTYVNDTTSTMPDATMAALAAWHGGARRRIVLIGGGTDKALRFGAWAPAVAQHAKALILFEGNATVKMRAALRRAKVTTPVFGARDMREAVRLAARVADKGDVVLLSPGCASFGLFLHEFDRGEKFVRAVRALRA